MATPVIDLRQRLRQAGFTEEQTDALAAGFESLHEELADIRLRLNRVETTLRIHSWLLALILAGVFAPYVKELFAG